MASRPSIVSAIHAVETAVPPYAYHQDYAMSCMKRWVQDKMLRRMVHAVYRQSGIERRFSVLPDFQPEAIARIFHESADGSLTEPTTGQRNRIFQEAYPALAEGAVQAAFQSAPWLQPSTVTHVITVSCTGFCNPGPDLYVSRRFGLSENVERYHLGFMGCYAAFPALRMADQFCQANPDAVVLVLCLELCSLHLQINPTTDSLLANALFADGAAAVMVSRKPLPSGIRGLALEYFAGRLIPEGEHDMAWTVGDRGFDMVLSSYVPRILGLRAKDLLHAMVAQSPMTWRDIHDWVVHPGGKAILTALESHMSWSPTGMMSHAHNVLRDYGNMSSATILFVLKAILQDRLLPESMCFGTLAFGPGLTVEMGLMRLMGRYEA